MLNRSNKNRAELTSEDKLQIELLVDGELDESARKRLLIRLEEIDGGWRFCAISFLEAQCLGETFTQSDFFVQNTNFTDQSPQVAVWDNKNIALGQNSRVNSGSSFGIDGNNALALQADVNPLPDSQLKRAPEPDDPLIIPLRKGGYQKRSRKTELSGGSGNGGGNSWKNMFAAVAGGFLLAIVLSGGIALLISNNNVDPQGNAVAVKNPAEIDSPENENVTNNSNSIASVANPSKNSSSPFHLVTFKTKNLDKNGVAVPCFEVNDFDSKALKELRKKSKNKQVENWKKAGKRVETTYEELVFPMKDGKVLILPVDTYKVHDAQENHFQ